MGAARRAHRRGGDRPQLPQLLDVKDLSTEDVRVALELKKDADEKMIMAYLFKHAAPDQLRVNLTA
jgi:DNA gyrase subunit A